MKLLPTFAPPSNCLEVPPFLAGERSFAYRDCCVSVLDRGPEAAARWSDGRPTLTLLFLHGRFGAGVCWERILDGLAGHFRCIQPDLPGFGRSFSARARGLSVLEQADLIKQVLTDLSAVDDRLVLVGHDIGGLLAQICVTLVPERVAGLVLVNSASLSQPASGIRPGAFGWNTRWMFHRLVDEAVNLPLEAQELLHEAWLNSSMKKDLLRSIRAIHESWPGHYQRLFFRNELRRIAPPLLALWGTHDSLNPPECGMELVRQFPDAMFFENSAAGHWPNLDNPAWITAKLREFLFRVAPARKAG